MKDQGLTRTTQRLYQVTDVTLIPLRSFVDLLLNDQDEDHRMIADVLDTVYNSCLSNLEREFKQIEGKVGVIEAIYSTSYDPNMGGGVFLDARLIPPGKDDPSSETAKKNSQPKPDDIPDFRTVQLRPAPAAEAGAKFYADDLIDQIALGYSAVDDMLQRIEKEPDEDTAATLAAMARVLHKNAVARKDEIVRELEKQTGKIKVLVDTTRGHSGYDLPIMGVKIHPKQEAANEK